MDAGGRVPTIGILGDVGTVTGSPVEDVAYLPYSKGLKGGAAPLFVKIFNKTLRLFLVHSPLPYIPAPGALLVHPYTLNKNCG
jgi:hypothetical protein